MIPRILSIASPLLVYVTLAILLTALWHERRKLEWLALVPAVAGLLASFVFLEPVHRLFFDEDIYISIAQNLTRAPVAQITLLGSPREVQVSSYYKEPSGWPVLLSLVFLITGRSETVAFVMGRVFFAIAIAAVYQLARAVLETRRQALAAAILFGAAPACFWFSPSAGTDIPAALAAALGIWGVLSGNGMLAAAGFALAAQMRLELIILVPMVWLSGRVSLKWKLVAMGLVSAEIVHLGWVISIAPVLAKAEKVSSAFSLEYVWGNLVTNLSHVLNPMIFPAAVTVFGIAGMVRSLRRAPAPLIQALALFGLYLLFYAGSFTINPRYTIQFLVPLAVMAASISKRPIVIAALLISTAIPYIQALELPTYVQALAADHRISVEFASHLQPGDLVVSTEPEMFLNYDRRAMNAVFASEHKERLEQELQRGRVVYHSGVRTNRPDSEEWSADQWVKSNFELHLIDSRQIRGLRIAFYEMLLKNLDREAR
jgi:hypothetical protein